MSTLARPALLGQLSTNHLADVERVSSYVMRSYVA
jgi:hypothetical protein